MTERAIVADGLLKRYGSITALRDTSFAVTKGTITGFVGRNGAGKTTTLKIVSTLMRADDGTCQVLGHDVHKEPYAIRGRIGFLPDIFDLPANLTLREYLGRVGLARALIHNPDLLVLDEPAAGLDPHARVELKELLRLLRERGKTVFLSSHVLADLEEICDELVVIRKGTVIFCGDIAGFRREMRSTTRWRLAAVSRPIAIPSGVRGEIVGSGPTSVDFEGELSASERARWIAELVAKGIDVCEVSPIRSTLEQEFAKSIEDEEEEEEAS